MNSNRWFRKVEEGLDLDRDPIDKFVFDPSLESHKKVLEDVRKTLTEMTDTCFRSCIKDVHAKTSQQEMKCVDSCVRDNFQAVKLLVVQATKNVN